MTAMRGNLLRKCGATVGGSRRTEADNTLLKVRANETANILNNATHRSPIILDEIGRGTSTYDGLSIAWAVVEHLHREPERGPRTLFATHYQELTPFVTRSCHEHAARIEIRGC